jgi:hypothetical protein
MSYQKVSGAKRRAAQREKDAKEKKLLAKVPTLDAFKFKQLSSTTAAEESIVASTSSSSEQTKINQISRFSQAESGSEVESVISSCESQHETILTHSFKSVITEATSGSSESKYDPDPATWKRNDIELVEHLIAVGQPESNEAKIYPESERHYPDQKRAMTSSLFYLTQKDGRQLRRDWMIYSKSTGGVFCFVCFLFSRKVTTFSTGFNDWKNANASTKAHENTIEHRDAMITWISRRSSSSCIDKALQLNTKCKGNTGAIFSNVYFLPSNSLVSVD